MPRTSISSKIKAKAVYPKFGSEKSATAEFVNFELTDAEALNLALSLLKSTQEANRVTVRLARKAAKKSGMHGVSVTYDNAHAKWYLFTEC